MRTPSMLEGLALLLPCALGAGTSACDDGAKTPALSLAEKIVKSAPIPAENAPALGVISETVHVREFTDKGAPSLGILRAGARLPRSLEPVSRAGCEGGWYAIRPRGFVCVGVEATLDLSHPTLAVMALAPKLDAPLPYTYARTRNETPLFERQPGREDAVREVGRLRRRAGMAVVGSWKARDPNGTETRLALLTNGRFVRASDLEAARPSEFEGVELGKQAGLPLAFVVKRGVRTFRINGNEADKGDLLDYHARLPLSGRFRSLGNVKYWALDAAKRAGEELWVRHQDVTVVQKRSVFPDFVRDDTHWLDVSVVTGTLLAYQGKTPVFATLVSVARELPAESGETAPASDGPRPIPLGAFAIVRKELTFLGKDSTPFGEAFEVQDAPWALQLSSGQLLHGSYWHDRFGIEHGAGSLALSPADAARVFRFVGPDLPTGWHAAAAAGTPQVVIRK
jgi:hypothetical protein